MCDSLVATHVYIGQFVLKVYRLWYALLTTWSTNQSYSWWHAMCQFERSKL